ncbi:MAG: glycosyltransferase family 2 protein [Patescibacteria group bacterium]
MKLSVTIITLNEEKNLTKCLESVKNIADEIIVIDSGSTDETVKIAKKFGARVFFRKFDNYANQKNFALEKTGGDWILSIDGDEEITQELAPEIEEVTKSTIYSAYSIPRKNIIFGKFIKYTRWQPELDRHVWLWKKGMGKWVGEVHEELEVRGKIGKLKNPKIHYQYDTVSEFLTMMNKYSSLETKNENPIYHFLVRYFYRLGFLDGWRGFVLSYLMAIYYLEIWVKKWERQI